LSGVEPEDVAGLMRAHTKTLREERAQSLLYVSCPDKAVAGWVGLTPIMCVTVRVCVCVACVCGTSNAVVAVLVSYAWMWPHDSLSPFQWPASSTLRTVFPIFLARRPTFSPPGRRLMKLLCSTRGYLQALTTRFPATHSRR